MAKEANAQTKVKVEVESIWKAVAKDLRFVAPKIMPSKVKSVDVLEGNDFSVGSIWSFNFVPNKISSGGYQNEKVVELLDEERDRVGQQVLERDGFKFVLINSFDFVHEISPGGYQNEKVVELDEERDRVGQQVLERDRFDFVLIRRFDFVPNISPRGYQNEKVVELDEERHRVGLQVLEGELESIWKATPWFVAPKIMPSKVESVDVLEGELDEELHRVGLQVVDISIIIIIIIIIIIKDFLTAQNK